MYISLMINVHRFLHGYIQDQLQIVNFALRRSPNGPCHLIGKSRVTVGTLHQRRVVCTNGLYEGPQFGQIRIVGRKSEVLVLVGVLVIDTADS